MEFFSTPAGLILSLPLLVVGSGAFLRGLVAYRDEARMADVASSPIGTLPAGEVRVSGIVEPAEVTLISPLQSVACVYYRASIRESSGDAQRTVLEDERAVSFRVRDASGKIRVVPRRVDWNVPDRFDEKTDLDGGDPAGLRRNMGPTTRAAAIDREQAIAELLTVQQPRGGPYAGFGRSGGETGARQYREARLEPGEVVTILGSARPYREVESELVGPGPIDDPELAADLVRAMAEGSLATSPEEAWGNAAIPGFGMGRPVRPPELDPDADAPAMPSEPEARAAEALAEARFEIGPDELVLGPPESGQLVVYPGAPSEAVAHERSTFLLGLVGAVVAIVAALLAATQLSSALR